MRSAAKASRRAARQVLGLALKSALKKLFLVLLPYLGAALAAFVLIFLLAVTVYAVMAPSGLLGLGSSDEDSKLLQRIEALCSEKNSQGAYLGTERLGFLADRFGRDQALKLKPGLVYGILLFWRLGQEGEAEVPESLAGRVAGMLAPSFRYKESVVTLKTDDGEKSRPVYLLVEADSPYGRYVYEYERRTDGGVTQELLKNVKKLSGYERLDSCLREVLEIPDDPEEVKLARRWVLEAERSYETKSQNLEWLAEEDLNGPFASASTVPPELVPFFREAESLYGIPWWFLAAVSLKESSFDPLAENEKTGCFGLMQVSPENWRRYAAELGFDPEADRENPRAQILVGSKILAGLLGEIDWSGGWREATLGALAFYGGFRGKDALERCRSEYAGPIWTAAERMRLPAVWPVSSRAVSSPFGWRVHPLTGRADFHEGVDIAAPEGEPVKSVSGGTVTYSGPCGGYGLCVIVTDGVHGYIYAHLSEVLAQKGAKVDPGTPLGLVGSTGSSTGPHLHLGVWRLRDGTWVDPLLVLCP